MTDLLDRFQALDDLRAPDLWREIEGRAAARPQRGARALPGALVVAILLLALALGGAALIGSGVIKLPTSLPGSWTATGTMTTARWNHTGTLLPDGRVLVAGGFGPGLGTPLATAELYNPATGTWTPTGSMREPRRGHTATLLPTGKVLVAGGDQGSLTAALASAELYDPTTGTWSATGSMSAGRDFQTATLLPDGRVLVAGGGGGEDDSVELYDPTAGTWSTAFSMVVARSGHSATLLPDGRVLVVSGQSAELRDPATGYWGLSGRMISPGSIATLLPGGTVLVPGWPATEGSSVTAETYDPATDTWSATSPMVDGRSPRFAVLLGSGLVLVVAGRDSGAGIGASDTAELYDPARRSWSTAAKPVALAAYPGTAVLLHDGTVLVAGGGTGGQAPVASAALYYPEGR